jgi:hypothetical protein
LILAELAANFKVESFIQQFAFLHCHPHEGGNSVNFSLDTRFFEYESIKLASMVLTNIGYLKKFAIIKNNLRNSSCNSVSSPLGLKTYQEHNSNLYKTIIVS